MDLFALLRAISRRWKLIAVLTLLSGVTGYGVTYGLKVQFEATSLVLLRPENELSITNQASTKELLNFPLSAAEDTHEAVTNTYVEIIQTRAMAIRIVDALHLEQPLPPGWLFVQFPWLDPFLDWLRGTIGDIRDYALYGRTFGRLSDYEEAVQMFLKGISLEAIPDTHLFEISYFGRSPQEAVDVSNTTANLFLEYVAGMNAKEQSSSLKFLSEQMVESGGTLARSREALRAFKKEARMVDLQEETAATIKLISELESQLEKTRAELAGLNASRGFASVDIDNLNAERDYLVRALNQRREALSHLSKLETTLSTLELDLFTAEETHKYLSREHEETRIRRAMELREMRIVSVASPPRAPARPKRILYAGAGAAVALIVGVYLVGIAELTNTTLRSIEDVDRTLGLEVLATIPEKKTPRARRT